MHAATSPDAGGPALVVGLGNPGPTYVGHRHNVGFHVLDVLAGRVGGRFKAHKARAEVVEGRLDGRRAVLARPRTYMNLSGAAVSGLTRYFAVPPDQLVVVHDELDLPFGSLRLKLGGDGNEVAPAVAPRRQHGDGAGLLQHVGRLVGAEVRIDRHDRQAGQPQRELGDDPLGHVLSPDGDPLAGLEAGE